MASARESIQQMIGEVVVKLCDKNVPIDRDSIIEKLLRVTHKEDAGSERNRVATMALEFLTKAEAKV
ncbi:hypothetical protein SOASR030_00500 [Leminorella grimontii]|uniref:Fumarate hydratase n=1 Tax=Leminorella grimontii TaxID=82981 RepID=A0AAV5MVT1_9GAMM|nr:hypothetical protein [Leminorella grimontii]KFC95490.1 hypothetical protein GLGR_2031 [Leminorella grimontii ATCC 33999 = DSM 5078]GKX53938.1 hypothetical protein SOASR030_00500 [Leminorella grimontii]VFS60529.1 Uncharacterised protein [Leminorella grimontii]